MSNRRFLPSWTRQWAGDSGIALLAQVQVTLVTTALAILLARDLGPSDWGLFSTFLGLAYAAGIVIDFGFAAWLLREFSAAWSRDPDDAPRLASELLSSLVMIAATLGTPLVLGSGIAVLLLGLSVELAATLAALMTYTVLSVLAYGFEAALRAQRRIRLVLAATILEKVALIALAGAVVLADLGFIALGAAYVISGAIRAGFTYTLTLRRFPPVQRWPGPVTAVRLVRGSIPFAFNFATLNAIPRLDVVIVAAFSTVSASYYAIGERVVSAAGMVPTVASMTLFPFLSAKGQRRSGAAAVGTLGALGLVAAALGALLAPSVVPFLFGDRYGSAVEVTQVMLLSLPFIFASNGLLTVLNVGRQERRLVKVTLPLSLAGSAGILVGQAAFGVLGASAAFTLRQVAFCAALVYLAARPAPDQGLSASEMIGDRDRIAKAPPS